MEFKSFVEKKEDVKRNWRIVDADGKVLGRLATQIATILRGKDKPTYTPHVDGGDFVVVINAEKIVLTGNKPDKKNYAYFTGYRGGLKSGPAKHLLEKNPEEMIRLAVYGMIPHYGALGRGMITKLKIYKGTSHPHEAQLKVKNA